MNQIELLKQLAATNPELLAQLEPSKGCQGYVLLRGVRYEGVFVSVYPQDGTWLGYFKPLNRSVDHLFMSGEIPVGSAQRAKIELDTEECLFYAVLDDKVPCTGDRAYCGGRTGILRMTGANIHINQGFIEPEDPKEDWLFHIGGETRGLMVGYDKPIVWDEKRQMFNAPADAD